MNDIKSVCIYCASSTKIAPVYFDAAARLGQILGEKGINVVNGAGSIGLMGTVSDSALAAGGKVTGVIPRFMVDENWHHQGLSELVEVDTMHQRKQIMMDISDGIIALPGGCGTMEELLEAITWKQLGLCLKPIVILNTNGFYDPLIEMLHRAIEQNFMRNQHAGIWQVADTPEQAVEQLMSAPLWDKDIRKFAAI